jgi:hypothetical protein
MDIHTSHFVHNPSVYFRKKPSKITQGKRNAALGGVEVKMGSSTSEGQSEHPRRKLLIFGCAIVKRLLFRL